MSESPTPISSPDPTDEGRQTRLRRYSLIVTGLLILAGVALVLLMVWGTGIQVTTLLRLPEIFNPTSDVCLRFGWHNVKGGAEPVRLCNEWIQLSDPSGEPHRLQQETHVVQGADGKLYFDHGTRMGYQAFGLIAWVMVLMGTGIAVKRRLVARYRVRHGLAGNAS